MRESSDGELLPVNEEPEQRRLVILIGERLLTLAGHLSLLAERKDKRRLPSVPKCLV